MSIGRTEISRLWAEMSNQAGRISKLETWKDMHEDDHDSIRNVMCEFGDRISRLEKWMEQNTVNWDEIPDGKNHDYCGCGEIKVDGVCPKTGEKSNTPTNSKRNCLNCGFSFTSNICPNCDAPYGIKSVNPEMISIPRDVAKDWAEWYPIDSMTHTKSINDFVIAVHKALQTKGEQNGNAGK